MKNTVAFILLAMALFAGLCAGSLTSKHFLAKLGEPVGYWRKFDWMVNTGKPYDTLLLGTSRVEEGIDSHCLDRENSKWCKNTLTINLANSSLNVLEVRELMKRTLIEKHGTIKRVIYEPDFLAHYTLTENKITPRATGYMSLSHAWELYRYLQEGSFPAGDPDYARAHTQRILINDIIEKTYRHITHVGTFWYLLKQYGTDNVWDSRHGDGFVQLDPNKEKIPDFAQARKEQLAEYQSNTFHLNPNQVSMIEELSAMVKQYGAKLYLFLPPGFLWDQAQFTAMSRDRPFSADIAVMDFAVPTDDTLYKEDNFLDGHHLTSKGVALMCPLVSRKLCEFEKDCHPDNR